MWRKFEICSNDTRSQNHINKSQDSYHNSVFHLLVTVVLKWFCLLNNLGDFRMTEEWICKWLQLWRIDWSQTFILISLKFFFVPKIENIFLIRSVCSVFELILMIPVLRCAQSQIFFVLIIISYSSSCQQDNINIAREMGLPAKFKRAKITRWINWKVSLRSFTRVKIASRLVCWLWNIFCCRTIK